MVLKQKYYNIKTINYLLCCSTNYLYCAVKPYKMIAWSMTNSFEKGRNLFIMVQTNLHGTALKWDCWIMIIVLHNAVWDAFFYTSVSIPDYEFSKWNKKIFSRDEGWLKNGLNYGVGWMHPVQQYDGDFFLVLKTLGPHPSELTDINGCQYCGLFWFKRCRGGGGMEIPHRLPSAIYKHISRLLKHFVTGTGM